MKTTYGIQLGNYLRNKKTSEILRVNGITKKKIGFLGNDGKEHYCYLPELSEIPLTLGILGKYKKYLSDYNKVKDEFFIVPEDSLNVYQVKWFHELQNILGFHNYIIEWID